MVDRTSPAIERLLAWREIDEHSGCWVWDRSICGSGYGRIRSDGTQWLAHRLSYELFRGPIPAELVIDHLCRNRKCINPAHLEVVTNRENGLRSPLIRGKTHCAQGHEFNAENTYWYRGQRRCKSCRRDRSRALERRAS